MTARCGFDPAVRRVAVIGDIGGHADELRAELRRLGAGDDGALPADLAVVQVGDLIHRGPDSAGVLALVDHYLSSRPGQWRQLVGNHEAHYLAPPIFSWPERLQPDAVATLRRWWAERSLRPAAAVVSEGEQLLITHAGLTSGLWRTLGSPADAVEAARVINELVDTDPQTLFRPGAMLRGRSRAERRLGAGPLWAEAHRELIVSWLDGPLPFSQIHGHSSVVDWQTGQTRLPAELASRLTLDRQARHSSLQLDGGRIIGVDPNHGRAAHPWRALLLPLG